MGSDHERQPDRFVVAMHSFHTLNTIILRLILCTADMYVDRYDVLYESTASQHGQVISWQHRLRQLCSRHSRFCRPCGILSKQTRCTRLGQECCEGSWKSRYSCQCGEHSLIQVQERSRSTTDLMRRLLQDRYRLR